MVRFNQVLLNSAAEALECAIELIRKDYNLIDTNIGEEDVFIFIDNKNREFFLTSIERMWYCVDIIVNHDKETIDEVYIKDIVKWQENKQAKQKAETKYSTLYCLN